LRYDGSGTSPNNLLKIRDELGGYGDVLTINQQGNTTVKGYLDSASLKIGGTEVIDASRNLKNIVEAYIEAYFTRDQVGNTTKFLTRAAATPNTHFHLFADYAKPEDATDITVFFGYNSEISKFEFKSKWTGANESLLRLDGANLVNYSRTFLPFSDNTFDLGKSDLGWRNIYFKGLICGDGNRVILKQALQQYGLAIGLGAGSTTVIASGEAVDQVWNNYGNLDDEYLILASDQGIKFFTKLQDGWGNHYEVMQMLPDGTVKSRTILPLADNTFDLGKPNLSWRYLFIAGIKNSAGEVVLEFG